MSTIDDDGAAPAVSSGSRPVAGSHGQSAGRARFDAFISYRRLPADTAFVDQLRETLAERGKDVWVDRTDIEPAADWSERILRGIEAAKAFIFVITTESLSEVAVVTQLVTQLLWESDGRTASITCDLLVKDAAGRSSRFSCEGMCDETKC